MLLQLIDCLFAQLLETCDKLGDWPVVPRVDIAQRVCLYSLVGSCVSSLGQHIALNSLNLAVSFFLGSPQRLQLRRGLGNLGGELVHG